MVKCKTCDMSRCARNILLHLIRATVASVEDPLYSTLSPLEDCIQLPPFLALVSTAESAIVCECQPTQQFMHSTSPSTSVYDLPRPDHNHLHSIASILFATCRSRHVHYCFRTTHIATTTTTTTTTASRSCPLARFGHSLCRVHSIGRSNH
jgi:hypothetical protein